MKITGSTEIYAIFGNPTSKSKSPIIQNFWMREAGLNAVYCAFEPKPEDFESCFTNLYKAGLKGGNITAPYKEAAAKLGTFKAEDVAIMGAANTYKINNTGYDVYNTDGLGLVFDLDKRADGWRENNEIITIIGAGGAAKGIIYALLTTAPKIIRIVARNLQVLEEIKILAQKFQNSANTEFEIYGWDNINNAISGAGLVINATSIGLYNNGDLILDLNTTNINATIYELIYIPAETAFFKCGIAAGRRALNGQGMLVGQGVLAFEKWFGIIPDFDKGFDLISKENA